MDAFSLQPLLEGAGLDALLSHVLPLLSLHDLGQLASTSRRLRAVVAEVPESTWQACARRIQPHPQHPIHRAASCQAYLRRQHAMHADISAGRSTLSTPAEQRVFLSPDFATHSWLLRRDGGAPSLQLLDAATQRERARFRLAPRSYRSVHFWDQASSCVALLWGAPWFADDHDSLALPASTGLCIVHARTGELSHIKLGLQSGCTLFEAFTPNGSVVLHQTLGTQLVWRVLDRAGAAQHSAPSLFAGHACCSAERLVIAPEGTHAASCLRAAYSACSCFGLWDLAPSSFRSVDAEHDVKDVLWSPCSLYVLCLTARGVQLWQQDQPLFRLHCEARVVGASWSGDVVAILCHRYADPKPDSASESDMESSPDVSLVSVYTVQDLRLSLSCQLDMADLLPGKWQLGRPELSPDWQHIAVSAQPYPDAQSHACHLMVFNTSGQLCLHAGVPGEHYCLRWSSEGDAVACHGFCPPVLRFA